MYSYNKTFLMGRLTADPELRTFENDRKVVTFCLAINRNWKGPDGQTREETEFIDCKMFGKRADVIANNMKKGRPLFVEGHLHEDKWVSKETGKERKKVRVIVDNFEFVDKRAANANDDIPSSAGNSFMSGSPDDYDAIVHDDSASENVVNEENGEVQF